MPTRLLPLLFALAGCGASERALAIAELTGDATDGAEVFAANCATCHGADAKSGTYPKDLKAKAQDAVGLAEKVLGGGIIMPKFAETLTDEQIADLIAHLASL